MKLSAGKGVPITIPCYLINLDRSRERLEHFLSQANAVGLEFVRVAAVDGNKLDKDTKATLFARRTGKLPLGPGEMGCFLSHRKVWARILADGVDWSFVAEDDIHFYNASRFFCNSDWLPKHVDLIKAETSRQRIQLHTIVESKPFGHELRRLNSYHFGTAGYFVSRLGAEILLEETVDKCDPLDLVMFHEDFGVTKSLRIFQLDPAICVQDYLFGRPDKLESLLESDRALRRKEQGLQGKPKGIAKVWRELSRPFIRISNVIMSNVKTMLGLALIKKVKFAGDRRT